MARRKRAAKSSKKSSPVKPTRRAKPAQYAAVVIREVDDPWEPGNKIAVPVNAHESPVEVLFSRGKLSKTQYDALDRFRKIYERAQLSPLQAMNPLKEAVDGSGASADFISQRNVSALHDLAEIRKRLIRTHYTLLCAVIGEGVSITKLSTSYKPLDGKYAVGYATGLILEATNALVAMWKMEVVGTEGDIVADRHSVVTGPTVEWSVGRRGDLVEKTRT